MPARDEVATHLRSAAAALDRASRHCRTAADHLESGDVPRMSAHALAARGELLSGSEVLDAAAKRHARQSETT